MTAVNIMGTFSKDERTNNGLERISDELVADEFGQRVVVGIIQQHHVGKNPGEPYRPIEKFVAIEPLFGDAATQGRQLLDEARKARNLDALGETLFDAEE